MLLTLLYRWTRRQLKAYWLTSSSTKLGATRSTSCRTTPLLAADCLGSRARASAVKSMRLGCAVSRNLTLRAEVSHV